MNNAGSSKQKTAIKNEDVTSTLDYIQENLFNHEVCTHKDVISLIS